MATSIPASISPEGSDKRIGVGKLLAFTRSLLDGESRRLRIRLFLISTDTDLLAACHYMYLPDLGPGVSQAIHSGGVAARRLLARCVHVLRGARMGLSLRTLLGSTRRLFMLV
jgi:hypothetical protein